MLKAVLFDCDGVLLDSEAIYLSCVAEYLKTLGRETVIDDIAYIVGSDMNTITAKLQRDFSLYDYSVEELINGQRAIFNKVFFGGSELSPMKNLIPFLKLLKENKIKTAVASSSAQSYVEFVLDTLGITEYFDAFIGRENAVHGKPAPDLYIKAMELIKVKPSEAVVIEDSANGIKAGVSAGCRVIGYYGSDIVKQDISEADIAVKDYGDIDIRLLNELLEKGRSKI